MNRSTYWGVIVTSVVAFAMSKQPSTTLIATLVLYLVGATAVFTAVFERAKATGRNPWLWVVLAFVPFMVFRLGLFPDAAAPQSPKFVKTIGLSFAGAVVFMIAAVVAYPLVTPLHDQLAQAVINDNASLPKKVDDITTLTAERLDGLQVTYVYELNGELSNSAQASLSNMLCNQPTPRDTLAKGVTYRYEYWNAGKFLGGFDVTSCQPTTAQSDYRHNDDFGGPLTYSYDIVDGRVTVHAKGSIALAEADAFNAWKHTLPDGLLRPGAILISLDSPGGSIAGALDFAKWIKDNKVDTVVANGATCASACALIWGAGWNKKAGVEAHIGVHGASNIDRNATDEQRGAAEADGTLTMARTLADEGAPASIIAATAVTLPNEMHWLTTADAVAWGATMLDKNGQPLYGSK